ncbi:MAG: glycosyltransferase [Planctomycetes bacterium]|nr:glycosyltransferase [Planctomycetota bacterium]
MRILLAHHAPPDTDLAGRQMLVLAGTLQAAGQEARILPIPDSDADRPFRRPSLTPNEDGGQDYCDLTSADLAIHRQMLRRGLDQEVHQFNPHIIHCQHIWVLAHLALESGAPYVITAHSAELDALARDGRYSRFAHQAAENAGRILVATTELATRVGQVFPELKEGVVVIPPTSAARVISVYEAVLRARGVTVD